MRVQGNKGLSDALSIISSNKPSGTSEGQGNSGKPQGSSGQQIVTDPQGNQVTLNINHSVKK